MFQGGGFGGIAPMGGKPVSRKAQVRTHDLSNPWSCITCCKLIKLLAARMNVMPLVTALSCTLPLSEKPRKRRQTSSRTL